MERRNGEKVNKRTKKNGFTELSHVGKLNEIREIRKSARRSCGFAIRRQKRLDHFKADLQSASSEFAYLASVLLADCKSAIVTHSMADYKSAKTEW